MYYICYFLYVLFDMYYVLCMYMNIGVPFVSKKAAIV